jgi:hypothetical protein
MEMKPKLEMILSFSIKLKMILFKILQILMATSLDTSKQMF